MSQHDFDIANQGFPALRADLNLALVALAENSSGATEPSVKFANMFWADTTAGLLKMRNQANNAWITVGALDTVNLGLTTRGFLAGLMLSNNGADATNDINIAIGSARNADDDGDLRLAAAVGKQIDVTWAAGGTPGAPTGGMSSSLTVANDTWYHVHLILVSGVVEVGFDTSITAANLVTDHGATEYRRIGSVRRGTAANLGFTQNGDQFLWDDPPLDVTTGSQGTSSIARTLTVPSGTGLKVKAIVNISISNVGTVTFYLRSLDANDEAPSVSAAPLATLVSAAGDTRVQKVEVMTNTGGQIGSRANQASTTLNIATLGYEDRRGQHD